MNARVELANAIRALAMDAVQQANSGHPGMPMGMAEIAEVLWNHHLRHNPANPAWVNRDRFVLSNGHGSMLLYALLHLTGYDLPMAELKRFRQLHSKTPGHPEYGCAPGRRDHHRAARPGHRQRGRHGARRDAARRGIQPARLRHRRPPHLRIPRRRLPDGGHLARGLRARRHARAWQADRDLRRQRHLDRFREGQHPPVVHRRRPAPLRGLRLAGDPERRRSRGHGGGPRAPQGEAGEDAPDADLRQDGDRERGAHQGQHRRGAWRAAR